MNVFVIPEDFRKDQFILKPIITALMKAIGKSNAVVRVCQDPLLGGVREALKWERLAEIIDERAGMVDLFLLIVDRDGDANRRRALDNLEERARSVLAAGKAFLAENAWQEVEVWVLGGHRLPREWSWAAVREERDPKERYFDPFARQKNLLVEPDGGRRTLALAAVKQYSRIRRLCPQDVASLETRIRIWLESSA